MSGAAPCERRDARAAMLELLDQLVKELEPYQHPERIALRSLGLDLRNATERAYSEDAFRIWTEAARAQPDDDVALHHIVIMRHARAIDLEQSDKPRAADEDWRAALDGWSRLAQMESFWTRIAGALAKDGRHPAVDELRAALPELVLRVHYDVAFQPAVPMHRARFHVELALAARFPAAAKDRVRAAAYDAAAQAIPSSAWLPGPGDREVLEQALAVVERFLEIDPGCRPALEDGVRLASRLLGNRVVEINGLGGASSRRQLVLAEMRAHGDKWSPYFAALIGAREQLDADLRGKLATWHRLLGDALNILGATDAAMPYFASAIVVAEAGSAEQRSARENRIVALADKAAGSAKQAAPDARAQCDAVRSHEDLDGRSACLLAQAYALLGEFGIAADVCREALEPRSDDEAMAQLGRDPDVHTRLADAFAQFTRMNDRKCAEELGAQAREHIEADRFDEAAEASTRALALAPDRYSYRILRAQVHILRLDPAAAQADLDAARAALRDDEPAREAIATLEQHCAELANDIQCFGTIGLAERRKARACYQAEDLGGAILHLRAAIARAPKAGIAALQKELAVACRGLAVRQTIDGIENCADPLRRLAIFDAAHELLTESVRLDPGDSNAKEDLERLEALRAQVREEADYVRKVGPQAAELRAKALALLAADSTRNLGRAIEELRRALAVCAAPGKAEIGKELARWLANSAVERANSATASAASSGAGAALEAAKRELVEARGLDPSSDPIAQNLAALEGVIQRREIEQLRSQAVAAYKSQDLYTAVDLLEQAHQMATGELATAVAKDLSIVLTQRAINDANEALSKMKGRS